MRYRITFLTIITFRNPLDSSEDQKIQGPDLSRYPPENKRRGDTFD